MDAVSFTDEQYHDHVAAVEETLARLRAGDVDSRTWYGRVARGWVVWSADRRAQQRRLIRELWDAQAPAAARDGRMVLLCGVAGAGKTTIRRDPTKGLDRGYVVVDPGEVVEAMAERGMAPRIDGLSPMEAGPLLHEEAWEIAERLAQLAYRERCNVLWEIPLNGPPRSRVDAVTAAGYELHGVFADAPVDTARQRMLVRHRRAEEDYRNGRGHGGLFIPEVVHESCKPTAAHNHPGASPETRLRGDSVNDLIKRFACDGADIEALAAGLLARWHARARVVAERTDWADVYRRCEQPPCDDDLFWINVAGDRGTLTAEQVDALFTLIDSAAAEAEVPIR